jgi:hypothetical protein
MILSYLSFHYYYICIPSWEPNHEKQTTSSHKVIYPTIEQTSEQKLSKSRAMRYAEMLGRLRSSPKKTSPKDVFPNEIWRSCLVELTPLLCEIVKSSLCVGMPEHHKHAIITPLIKKRGSEQNCLSNYRPVSNLSTLSQ